MTKVRLIQDLKKMLKSSIRNQLGQKFHFLLSIIFSKFLDEIKGNALKHQAK